MAELFLGPLIEKTIEKVIEKLSDVILDYLKDQVRRQRGLREELQKLQKILPQIQAVLSACRKVEIKDEAINIWYWQLRDAIDEAEDVLDDFEYMKLEKQVSKNKKTGKVRSLMKSIKKKIVVIGKRALKIDPYLERLEVALKNLNEISSEVSTFRDLLKDEKKEQEKQELDVLRNRETGSLIKNVLVGRSDEMEIVSKWLRNSNQTQSTDTTDLYKNISLLSIVGHGGMGKTTLLQHIYNDATTLFDVQMWVCVSTNFNAKTVIKNILESIKKGRPDQDSLDSLQKSLQSKVKNQRFLLVLDDIWEADEEKWKNVFASLRDGNPGSKILISTRIPSIASNIPIENKETFQLKGLEENECFSLFKTHAFGKNSNVPESFLSIARDIAKKLSGSPLAAKVIGSSLKSKDMSYWSKVLNTDIGNLGQNDLLPILKLSYTYLPDFLQICFAFCSIYPEDHKFDKDDLVRAWIALNFVQSPDINSQETIEEIGRSYFDILVEKSFFDKFQDGNDDAVYYQMHDLLHNLAQSVSQKECFRATNVKELLTPPKTIRHLSLDINDSLEASFKEMTKFKNLRSLFLSYDGNNNENFVVALSKIFEISKSIRLLYIAARYQKEISEMICCLTHLRYFYLNSNVYELPRSISQLYHLQTIINDGVVYSSCCNDFFPRDINNLYNLRYLRLPFDKKCMIYEIGKLKSLHESNCFYVKNEIGYGIEELEHMKELRKIHIHQLENIKDVGKVRSAKFYDKENLTDLSLSWDDNRVQRENIVDHDLDEKILNDIKPYNNLKKLYISSYMGVRSAIWMINISVISNLEYIKLFRCLKWKTLPSFGQLPFLKFLYLQDMSEVEQIDHNKDCMFPSLEILHIENLEALQEWFDTTAAATENGLFFPRLIELCLSNCPKLQVLPSLPTKLQKLEMKNVGWKSCNWLQGVRNCSIYIKNSADIIYLKGRQELKTNENCQLIIDAQLDIRDPSLLLLEPLRSTSSLRSLSIEENDELVSFPSETWQWILLQHHSSLFKLNFWNLQSLQSLPSSFESLSLVTLELHNLKSLKYLPSSLSTISSLKDLPLTNIPLLKSLPDLPSSLVRLHLKDLESLQCLPSSLSTISSLEYLQLMNIPLLKSLPDLPSISSFKDLTLRNIPLLKLLPDLPSSLKNLYLQDLESLECLPSSLSTISSHTTLSLTNIPLLKSLPDLPSSLICLYLKGLLSLQMQPSSLSIISSLTSLYLKNIPLLKSLTDLPSSLKDLNLENLESLQRLPSSLSTISSLTVLHLRNIPLLKSLPDLPSSLKTLYLENLKSLQCLSSSLSTISSFGGLRLINIPLLKSLPDLPSSLNFLILKDLESLQCLPSSLSTISSLTILHLINIPVLKSLPDLPASLEELYLEDLESLQCLPSSLSTISSLKNLTLTSIPLLKSLPDLPSSLERLYLEDLESLQCLLSTISSLTFLTLINISLLKSLPDLPASLEVLRIRDCHPRLEERYSSFDRSR